MEIDDLITPASVIANLRATNKRQALFARLEKPIEFDAIDSQPVDLIFLLLTPAAAGTDHLKALALISRLLRNRAMCTKLRAMDSADTIYAFLIDRAASHAAQHLALARPPPTQPRV